MVKRRNAEPVQGISAYEAKRQRNMKDNAAVRYLHPPRLSRP